MLSKYFIKSQEFHPFQVLIIENNKAFINFGVILSFGKNNLLNTIVPTINNKQIGRDKDESFPTNNILQVSNNGVIYLEITFEDNNSYLTKYINDWNSQLYPKYTQVIRKNTPTDTTTPTTTIPETVIPSIDNNFGSRGNQGYTGPPPPPPASTRTYWEVQLIFSSPLMLDTPPVTGAELKFSAVSNINTLAQNTDYLLVKDDKKRVAIATIENGEINQLISEDYAVSIPIIFNDKFKEDFD